jgi:glycosyltransferase involved in cell wall biosynthesis
VARGIQNKILEAMAMAQPVATVPSCADAIGVSDQEGIIRASIPDEFVQVLSGMLAAPERTAALGQAARRCVVEQYSWQAHLSGMDPYLPEKISL